MPLNKKQEAYAQLAAKGVEDLQAMHESGYKAKSEKNARRQLRNLKSNREVQNRINELQGARIHATGVVSKNDTREAIEIASALDFFQSIYEDATQPEKAQVECAEAALPYEFIENGKDSKALKALQKIYKNHEKDLKLRVRTAKVSVEYEEGSPNLGKKEEAEKTATQIADQGTFATLSNQLDIPSPTSVQ